MNSQNVLQTFDLNYITSSLSYQFRIIGSINAPTKQAVNSSQDLSLFKIFFFFFFPFLTFLHYLNCGYFSLVETLTHLCP